MLIQKQPENKAAGGPSANDMTQGRSYCQSMQSFASITVSNEN